MKTDDYRIMCLYTLCTTCMNYENFQKTKIMELPVYCTGPIPNHPYGAWCQQRPVLSREDQTASPISVQEPIAVKDEGKIQPTMTSQTIHDVEIDDISKNSSDYSTEYEDDIVVHDGQSHRTNMPDISSSGRERESDSLDVLRATAGAAFINSTTNMSSMSKTTLETVMENKKM